MQFYADDAYIILDSGEMVILSMKSGRRKSILEFVGVLSKFEILDSLLLLVTTQGKVSVRNLLTGKNVASCSMEIFKTRNLRVHKMWLRTTGGPIFNVSTNDGTIFCWNSEKKSWQVTHKSCSFLFTSSENRNLSISEMAAHPSGGLNTQTSFPPSKNGKFFT